MLPVTSSLCGGASLYSLNIIVALNVMLVHLYTAVSVIPYTALTVNLCIQVNIKRVLGVPFAHGTADLVRGHPALVKPGREEVIAEYAGQQHLLLHDVQIQGETTDEQPLDDPWFGQVS